MSKGPSTASALLAHLQEKQGKPSPAKKTNTAQSLEQVFKAVAPKHNEMTCIPSFTMKDKGQLGRLAKSWGSKADEVMTAICTDWVKFAKSVSAATGNNNRPLQPHLPFIAKYADFAKAFLDAESGGSAISCTEQPEVTVVETTESAAQDSNGHGALVSIVAPVTKPKKKLLIIKKGPNPDKKIPITGEPNSKPDDQGSKSSQEEDDQLMSMEALLAYGEKFKT